MEPREVRSKEMQPGRFVILTGHLKDYPLSDLVGILRHQQKTGRLLIEYPKGPATLYFRDGELVDAQLDNLTGLQAVCVAVAQPPSSFNFNPLIQPPKRSIENSMQRVVSELLGCWDENGLEIETISANRATVQPALAQAAAQPALLAAAPSFNVSQTTRADQALVFSSVALQVPKSTYSRPVLAMAAAGLMMIGLSTVIALTRGFGRIAAPTASQPVTAAAANPTSGKKEDSIDLSVTAGIQGSEIAVETPRKNAGIATESSNRKPTVAAKQPQRTIAPTDARSEEPKQQQPSTEESSKVESVKVIVRVENGRVAQASIANPKPGMNAYEAMALRIARQRRYPAKSTGPETVVIKVTPSN